MEEQKETEVKTVTAAAEEAAAEAVVKSEKQVEPAEKAKVKKNENIDYTFEFKTGEEMDEGYIAGFRTLAQEIGLTQEQARKIMSANAEYFNNDRSRMDKALCEQAEEYEREARQELGAHFDESLSYAAKALDKYDINGALRKVLNVLPIGNNVELIKVFARMGKDIAEDKLVSGSFTGGEKSIEERLYPNQK